MKTFNKIQINSYKSDGFIGKYQRLVRDTVIPYQYSVLCDEAPNAAKSHVVKNFINAGKALRGEDTDDGFYGEVFQDSDAAKWIEAAAYSLSVFPDKKLEETVDNLIDLIEKAQDNDGYLDTRFTIKDKDKRWTNLLEAHELYCAGHMMEAACAYYRVTGKTKLLDVMTRNAEYLYKIFVEQKKEGYPGHPEVELALLRMYRATKNEKCFLLAEHFINIRGVDPYFYEKEKEKRNWIVWGNNPVSHEYQQSAKPVREQTEATGHSVRACYLYSAMADLASITQDKELYNACKTLWNSITQKRMYVTGGIGSSVHGEAFTVDYDLPSDTAYSETCASIALMFFAQRMLQNEVRGEYADVMERAFYNTVLAGMQLDGKRFFYVNPLEVIPGISGISPTHRHDLPERPSWFGCACCPPNAARLISSFGQYAYGENDDTVFCNLYASGTVKFKNGMEIVCKTEYPYGFNVEYSIIKGGNLAIRIPSWSKISKIYVNNKEITPDIKDGYAYLKAESGVTIKLQLDDTPRFVYANSKATAIAGKIALCRGPLVYCFEGVDNENDVFAISLKRGSDIYVSDFDETLLGGTVKMSVQALKSEETNTLYSLDAPSVKEVSAVAVPYYTWGNRGLNQMRVWMNNTL